MTFCSHPRENGDPDSRGDPHALRAGDDARHFRGNVTKMQDFGYPERGFSGYYVANAS